VISRRARRGILAVAAADALAAWWPQRHGVGPVRFVIARRLEDLAYGAGLWWGALRARDLRALLPARAPRL
jgi:mycofactocin glycosyltransferase